MTSSSDPQKGPQTDAERHAATLAAFEKSPYATVVPVTSQTWLLDAKGFAAVKKQLGR